MFAQKCILVQSKTNNNLAQSAMDCIAMKCVGCDTDFGHEAVGEIERCMCDKLNER